MESGKYELFKVTELSEAQQKEADEMSLFVDFADDAAKDKFVKGMFSYESLWHTENANNNNPEYILSRQYVSDSWDYQDMTRYTLMRPNQLGGWSSVTPTQNLVDAYWASNGDAPSLASSESRAAAYKTMRADYDAFVTEFNKRELTSILSQMNKSVTGTKQEATEKAIMAIENIVNEAQARYVQRLIDRMLSLKVQDVNGKNMSIAKNVDDSTRKILSFIKGSASDLRTSGYEDEIRHLRSQNLSSRQDIEALERKIKLSDDEAEKEELQKEIDELNGIISANNEKLEDLNNEIESILKSKAEITDRDIETELDNLYEKMDRAAEGNAVWTISDNERMTSLLLLKQVRDYQKTDSQAVDIEDQIRQEFLNRTELYRKRAKEAYSEKRQKLTEAIKNKTIRIRALTESMNALKKQKVDMMIDFSEELRNIISGGKDSLRRKIEEENERRGMLIINTLKDITGDKKINILDNKPRTENWFKKFIFSPLYSFEFLAKMTTKYYGAYLQTTQG